MKKFGPCTGRYCPMQNGFITRGCKSENCKHRTDLSFELYTWIINGLLIEAGLGTSITERFANIDKALAEMKEYLLHENMTEV